MPYGPLNRLGEYCAEALAEHGCPSVSVAVAERGEVVLAEAYGVADLARGRPATPATAYGLASVTKPVTATAVCLAADEGLLDLDAPVPLPGEHRWPAPTARQLLRHRGGFPAFYAWDYGDDERRIDASRYASLYRAPGTGFEYANLGYRALGLLLEAVTGQELSAFVRERVFEPLGLTGCRVGRSYPGPAPSAVRYTPDGRAYPDYDCDHPGATLGWAPAGELALFAQSCERLLKPATAAAMNEAVPLNALVGYGLGWCVSYGDGPVVRSHGGGGGGVAAMTAAVPARDLSVAVLTNSTSKAARDAIVHYVLDALVPGYRPELIDPGIHGPERPTDLPEGLWAGRIGTPEGDVPVELRTRKDGRVELLLDGVRTDSVAVAAESCDLRAVFPAQLPTADARVNSPSLLLSLRRERALGQGAERLTGVAHAFKDDGDREGRLGNFLCHPCELTAQPASTSSARSTSAVVL
ncbi:MULTISPECIES: serine hydrolase domain-containing protein [unclassified Streptomyces]|uniref:serine hydrolase domain-containing protein n=1 Tax=unclassified Streptomyces TaxID=2593676 RepID=UPI0034157DBD